MLNRPPTEVKRLQNEAKPKSHFTSQSQSGQGQGRPSTERETERVERRDWQRGRGRLSKCIVHRVIDIGQGRALIDLNPTILAFDLQTLLPHYQNIHVQNTREQIRGGYSCWGFDLELKCTRAWSPNVRNQPFYIMTSSLMAPNSWPGNGAIMFESFKPKMSDDGSN